MQLPARDEKRVRWDDFKRFHIRHANEYNGIRLTEFVDTGEVIVNGERNGDVALRHERVAFGASNLATADWKLWHNWTLSLPDGTECKQAWLNEGGHQLLWIDHQHGIALNGSCTEKAPAHWPAFLRARAVAVYYTGPQDRPSAAGTISVSMPTKRSPEERAQIAAVTTAARAWATLHPEIERIEQSISTHAAMFRETGSLYAELYAQRYKANLQMVGSTVGFRNSAIKGVQDTEVLTTPFDQLPNLTKLQLALCGTYTPRTVIEAPYLVATRKHNV